MIRRIVLTLAAVALLGVTSATAYVPSSGTVSEVDKAVAVIILTGGRAFEVVPDTRMLVDDKPNVDWRILRPATAVMIFAGVPVELNAGRHVAWESTPLALSALPTDVSLEDVMQQEIEIYQR